MIKKFIYKLFLNDKFIIAVILINSVIIFIQESHYNNAIISAIDLVCTFIFIIEMIVKHIQMGFKEYWKKGLNRLDGILVILSIPSIILLFVPKEMADLSFFMVLRVYRLFRFFRLVHIFPNFTVIANNFKLALEQSRAIMMGFGVLIITFAMIGSCLFSDEAPEYFGTPLDGIYSTFRLFTIEGWYEIPDTIAERMNSSFWGHLVRFYFCALLVIGGVIGMSLINSIFVDAMVSDNNDDVKEQLSRMESKIDRLVDELDRREKALVEKDALISQKDIEIHNLQAQIHDGQNSVEAPQSGDGASSQPKA